MEFQDIMRLIAYDIINGTYVLTVIRIGSVSYSVSSSDKHLQTNIGTSS